MTRRRALPVATLSILALATLGAAAATTPAAFTSTYLGGSGSEIGWAVDVGADGHIYAAGTTTSADFPGASGAVARNGDAFVAKFSPDGRTLVWARLLGGTLYDYATGVRATSDGVYVAGTTASPDFPTGGTIVFDSAFAGASEGFLVKLDAAGATRWGTFLGGSARDEVHALDLAPDGKPIVAGVTTSCDFYVWDGASQRPPSGCAAHAGDAFVSRFWPDGAMHRSTVLGGSGAETLGGIAVDGVGGSILIAGDTTSTDFPLAGAPYQSRPDDAFVAKLESGLDAVAYATYLGGSNGPDKVGGVARDRAGNAYVAGTTRATDFPTTAGAYRSGHQSPTQCGGPCDDAFVAKLDATGTNLAWATYLGGASADSAADVGLGADESVWVAGVTQSGAPFLPEGTGGGFNDGYLAVLEPAGNALRHIATLGGSDWDEPFDLRVVSGQAWVTGFTHSSDYPTAAGAHDRTRGGPDDAFLTAFDADPRPPTLAFDHRAGNEWWVEVAVSGAPAGAVQARDDGGPWMDLAAKPWGTWGASFRIEPGHRVQFRAFAEAQWVESCWFTHPDGLEECGGGGGFQAAFLNPRGNEWWIETDVSANQEVTRVEVQRDGGTPTAMSKTEWGSWAVSAHAPSGTIVRFLAWGAGGGAPVASGCHRWTTAEPVACPPGPTAPPVFDHKAGNEWWVEAVVTQQTPSRVQAMDTGGAWVELSLRDWGAWAGSFHIEPGHDVRFRSLSGSTWYESCWFSHPGGQARTGGSTCAGAAT